MSGTAVIAGVGPGFGEEFAWRLAREGHPVALFARSNDYLNDVESELREEGFDALAVPTDVTDPEAVTEGFDRIRDAFGPVEVLSHMASTVTGGSKEELDPERLERMWRLYAYGGLLCFREALPDMRERGGTTLFFGASPEAGDFAFKSGKDATRGLARSLADEYGPDGIHVAHVTIDGQLLNPDVYESEGDVNEAEYIDPAAAAETCYHLVDQPDRARTFELDLHANDRTTRQ
ncbi:MAG: SDR family NAD(P)-dependent oxidoreductase [Halodesulfurarchaeum sp.]